jgi:hypothetical protein
MTTVPGSAIRRWTGVKEVDPMSNPAAQPASRAALEIRLLPADDARLVRITEYLAAANGSTDGGTSLCAHLLPYRPGGPLPALARSAEDEWRQATWEDAEWQ